MEVFYIYCIIVYYATRENFFLFYVWSLMPDQSESNNYTSKVNVFPVLHTIFFLLGGQKMNLFVSRGAIKSTLWPASRKNTFFDDKNRIYKKRIVYTITMCFFSLFQKKFSVNLTENFWKHLFSSRKQTFLLSRKSTELLCRFPYKSVY